MHELPAPAFVHQHVTAAYHMPGSMLADHWLSNSEHPFLIAEQNDIRIREGRDLEDVAVSLSLCT